MNNTEIEIEIFSEPQHEGKVKTRWDDFSVEEYNFHERRKLCYFGSDKFIRFDAHHL